MASLLYLFLKVVLLFPFLLLFQCSSYEKLPQVTKNYDKSILKTPSGHGLVKKDYPFDDQGRYRKDWIYKKSKGRAFTSYKHKPLNKSTIDNNYGKSLPMLASIKKGNNKPNYNKVSLDSKGKAFRDKQSYVKNTLVVSKSNTDQSNKLLNNKPNYNKVSLDSKGKAFRDKQSYVKNTLVVNKSNTDQSNKLLNNNPIINHTVRSGDTLYSISKKYNTTVNNIRKVNNLKNDVIVLNQNLIIKKII